MRKKAPSGTQTRTANHRPRRAIEAAWTLCAALTIGCSSTGKSGPERTELTVTSAQTLRGDYEALKGNVDTTIGALDKVVAATDKSSILPWKKRTAEGELNPAYSEFVAELENLRSQYARTTEHGATFRTRGQEFVEGWKQDMAQLENPEIKQKSEQGLAEAEAKVASARTELEQVRKDYEAFQRDLVEIETALGLDLKQDGVLALEKVIGQAKDDAQSVKKDIDKIVIAMDQLIAVMTSSG